MASLKQKYNKTLDIHMQLKMCFLSSSGSPPPAPGHANPMKLPEYFRLEWKTWFICSITTAIHEREQPVGSSCVVPGTSGNTASGSRCAKFLLASPQSHPFYREHNGEHLSSLSFRNKWSNWQGSRGKRATGRKGWKRFGSQEVLQASVNLSRRQITYCLFTSNKYKCFAIFGLRTSTGTVAVCIAPRWYVKCHVKVNFLSMHTSRKTRNRSWQKLLLGTTVPRILPTSMATSGTAKLWFTKRNIPRASHNRVLTKVEAGFGKVRFLGGRLPNSPSSHGSLTPMAFPSCKFHQIACPDSVLDMTYLEKGYWFWIGMDTQGSEEPFSHP